MKPNSPRRACASIASARQPVGDAAVLHARAQARRRRPSGSASRRRAGARETSRQACRASSANRSLSMLLEQPLDEARGGSRATQSFALASGACARAAPTTDVTSGSVDDADEQSRDGAAPADPARGAAGARAAQRTERVADRRPRSARHRCRRRRPPPCARAGTTCRRTRAAAPAGALRMISGLPIGSRSA